jgi:hypothetical protein
MGLPGVWNDAFPTTRVEASPSGAHRILIVDTGIHRFRVPRAYPMVNTFLYQRRGQPARISSHTTTGWRASVRPRWKGSRNGGADIGAGHGGHISVWQHQGKSRCGLIGRDGGVETCEKSS